MKPEELFEKCIETIAERGKQRDQPDGERSFRPAADIYNSISEGMVSATTVIDTMISIKLARKKLEAEKRIINEDTWIDLLCYIALSYELLTEGKEPVR